MSKTGTLSTALARLGACNDTADDAVPWAERGGYTTSARDLRRAWQDCTDVDWMLWLASHINVPDCWLRMAAVWFACDVLPLTLPGSAERRASVRVLRVVVRHARGEATDVELRAAGDAAGDAAWVAAWDAACRAARAAAWAAACGAAWDAARASAWDAACGAAGDADWVAALDAARAAKRREQCDILRRAIPWRIWRDAWIETMPVRRVA